MKPFQLTKILLTLLSVAAIAWSVVTYYPPARQFIRKQINHALLRAAEIRYEFIGVEA